MKFKIGDKVRLLPSATIMFIAEEEVGRTGVITHYRSPTSMTIYMDRPRKSVGIRTDWCVEASYIELVIETGQMLFDFMSKPLKMDKPLKVWEGE